MGADRSRPELRAAAVLFDLDGTLVHTSPDLADSASRMLADLGRSAVDAALIEGWIGDGVSRLVKRALTGERDAEPDPELFRVGYARFIEHYGRGVSARSRPYPGVRAGLDALRGAGLPLACVTSKLGVFTHALLRDLELAQYFELVVAGDSLPRTKPDPLPLLHACSRLGVAPGQAVMVGDSENDALAARAAGCPFVGVTYGYNGGREPESLAADALIGSLERLLPLLDVAARPDRHF
jgi:phosphoglycolate phosphatase